MLTECNFFHGNRISLASEELEEQHRLRLDFSPEEMNALLSPSSKEEFKNMMFRLEPQRFVARPQALSDIISEDDLLQHILNDVNFNGFVCLQSGNETADDQAARSMSFVQQKSDFYYEPTDAILEEWGPGYGQLLRDQLKRKHPDKAHDESWINEAMHAHYSSRSKIPQTVMRKHLKKPGVMHTSYFRWLYFERNFRNFSILHYVHYAKSTSIGEWMDRLMQKRHECKKKGEGKSLYASCLKLILNSCYGYGMISCDSFTSGTVVNETTLARRKMDRRLVDIVPLGVIKGNRQRFKKMSAELLYLIIEKSQDSLKSNNCLTFSASLLGYSKVAFLSKIANLINWADPKKMQIVYMDTDSAFMYMTEASYDDCVLPGLKSDYLTRKKKLIFEDERSSLSQDGLFSHEYTAVWALFRGIKAYMLRGIVEDQNLARLREEIRDEENGAVKKIVKAKGIPHHTR